jgi:hypothetical protein
MRKTNFAILLLCVLLLASCKKNAPALSYPFGSWTFNNTTFRATGCTRDSADIELIALDSLTGNPDCNLIVYFNGPFPAASGTYTVASAGFQPGAGQVGIGLGYVAPGVLDNYVSTGGGGNQKVNVMVNNGKINVSASGIMMVNTGLGTDSNTLTFNITQSQ